MYSVLILSAAEAGSFSQETIQAANYFAYSLVYTSPVKAEAYNAYQAGARGFLLKPYAAASVSRLIAGLNRPDAPVYAKNDFILVKQKKEKCGDGACYINIQLSDVIAFECKGNYLVLHMAGGTAVTAYLCTADLMDIFSKYPAFIHISRSYIISGRHIKSISAHAVTLSGDMVINVGDAYKHNLDVNINAHVLRTGRGRGCTRGGHAA